MDSLDYIILINIKKSIKKNDIITEKNDIDRIKNNYIVISYRWGNVNKWKTKTVNYTCDITAFEKNTFMKLLNIINEDNKCNYLWIDTICIDQNDEINKRKNIMNMNTIFKNSYRIVCVPELNDIIYKIINKVDYNYVIENIKYYFSKNDIYICNNHILKCYKKLKNKIILNDKFFYKIILPILLYICKNNIKLYDGVINEFVETPFVYNLIKYISYLTYKIKEWSERTWVTSEIVMGLKKNKLYIILLSTCYYDKINEFNNLFDIEIDNPLCLFNIYQDNLNVEINDINIVDCIFRTKSTYEKDKFIAILVHTKYKDSKYYGNFVTYKDMIKELFKILSNKGKIYLLSIIFNPNITYKECDFFDLNIEIDVNYLLDIKLYIKTNYHYENHILLFKESRDKYSIDYDYSIIYKNLYFIDTSDKCLYYFLIENNDLAEIKDMKTFLFFINQKHINYMLQKIYNYQENNNLCSKYTIKKKYIKINNDFLLPP